MIPRHLDLPTLLRKRHHSSPVPARLVPGVVLVGDDVVDHHVHLVGAVGVEADGLGGAPGDLRQQGAAESADFWTGVSGVVIGVDWGARGIWGGEVGRGWGWGSVVASWKES
jgi:hypothetical protein